MKILITGAHGLLAQSIRSKFDTPENGLLLTGSEDLDITRPDDVMRYISTYRPDIIINCAACVNIETTHRDPALAKRVNSDGPKYLALAARANDATLVHFSTDYVFEGNKPLDQIYSEDDDKKPVSVYGETKLAGEQAIADSMEKYYILRTAWLYGEGKNFVRTILELAKAQGEVSVVNDQHGSPTYTEDLADILSQIISLKLPYGIYHATNLGFTTWYDFTCKIMRLTNTGCKVKPITSEEFASVAKRPKNSQMSKDKLLRYSIKIPTWEDALERYLTKEKQK